MLHKSRGHLWTKQRWFRDQGWSESITYQCSFTVFSCTGNTWILNYKNTFCSWFFLVERDSTWEILPISQSPLITVSSKSETFLQVYSFYIKVIIRVGNTPNPAEKRSRQVLPNEAWVDRMSHREKKI